LRLGAALCVGREVFVAAGPTGGLATGGAAGLTGAVAGAAYPHLHAAMAGMSHAGAVITPATGATRAYHDAKYAVFQRLYADQRAYRALMAEAQL